VSGLEDAAYAALVPLLESTYPGLTAVIREEQIERTNWENLLFNGSLIPPFAITRLGPCASEGWGLDNEVYRLPVTVTLVVSLTDTGASVTGGSDITAYLLQQFGLLRSALINYSDGAFQLAGDYPVVNVSIRTEANRQISNLLAGLQTGELECGLLVGKFAN
jgi:hypothetical protein